MRPTTVADGATPFKPSVRRTGSSEMRMRLGEVRVAAVLAAARLTASLLTFLRASFFLFSDPATTGIYTLSLHDALPICLQRADHHRDLTGEPARRVPPARDAGGTVRRPRPARRRAGGRERRRRRYQCDVSQRPRRRRRSEEHTSELQSLAYLVCRLLLEK